MKLRPRDRVEEIFKKVNSDRLPFKIDANKLNELGLDIADDLVLVANAKTVMVSFDHIQGVSIPWREELRAPLKEFGIGRPDFAA